MKLAVVQTTVLCRLGKVNQSCFQVCHMSLVQAVKGHGPEDILYSMTVFWMRDGETELSGRQLEWKDHLGFQGALQTTDDLVKQVVVEAVLAEELVVSAGLCYAAIFQN